MGGHLAKNNGDARRKFSKKTLKGTNFKQHKTHSVTFFLAQCLKRYRESNDGHPRHFHMEVPPPPSGIYIPVMFITLSGTNLQIWTPKRYDGHPRHFHMGVPPPGSNMPAALKLSASNKRCLVVKGLRCFFECSVFSSKCSNYNVDIVLHGLKLFRSMIDLVCEDPYQDIFVI